MAYNGIVALPLAKQNAFKLPKNISEAQYKLIVDKAISLMKHPYITKHDTDEIGKVLFSDKLQDIRTLQNLISEISNRLQGGRRRRTRRNKKSKKSMRRRR
jgi:hypothetical protein